MPKQCMNGEPIETPGVLRCLLGLHGGFPSIGTCLHSCARYEAIDIELDEIWKQKAAKPGPCRGCGGRL